MTIVRVTQAPNTEATPYDVAEHLRAPDEMAAYREAWLQEAPDDVAGISRALADIARAKGMSLVAKDVWLSCEGIPSPCPRA